MRTSLKGLLTLLVDDTEHIRKHISTQIRALGISVQEVENGVEALDLLRKQEFDLIITDIVMPQMDGFELCEEIRKSPRWSHIPVIVSSTYADSDHIAKALRLGADDFLPKPTEADLVEKVVRRVILPLLEAT